jgi:DNA replication protein DnaC
MGLINRIQYVPYNREVAFGTLQSILKSIEPRYKLQNPRLLKELISYLHAADGSEINPQKALGLFGNTGSGKTLHLQAIAEYAKIDELKFIRSGKVANFVPELISAQSLVSQFGKNGFDGIDKWIRKPAIIIDDVGTEQAAQNYGNKLEVFAYFIEERYLQHKITHISSNLSLDELKERYGERVYGRLIERTNIVYFADKNWRLF